MTTPRTRRATPASPQTGLPGQVVLVLQGGGALGASQVGVYEALHDAGIEPEWVIGTSIGAINADRKSTRLNSSHLRLSRMPSSA